MYIQRVLGVKFRVREAHVLIIDGWLERWWLLSHVALCYVRLSRVGFFSEYVSEFLGGDEGFFVPS